MKEQERTRLELIKIRVRFTCLSQNSSQAFSCVVELRVDPNHPNEIDNLWQQRRDLFRGRLRQLVARLLEDHEKLQIALGLVGTLLKKSNISRRHVEHRSVKRHASAMLYYMQNAISHMTTDTDLQFDPASEYNLITIIVGENIGVNPGGQGLQPPDLGCGVMGSP